MRQEAEERHKVDFMYTYDKTIADQQRLRALVHAEIQIPLVVAGRSRPVTRHILFGGGAPFAATSQVRSILMSRRAWILIIIVIAYVVIFGVIIPTPPSYL